MADAILHTKLDGILLGQEQARLRDEDLASRIGEVDGVLRQNLTALLSFSQQQTLLRESIDKLASAANGEKPGAKSNDLAENVRRILELLEDQSGLLRRAAQSLDRLAGVRTSPPG